MTDKTPSAAPIGLPRFSPAHDEPIAYRQRIRSYYQALGYGAPYEWAHYPEVPFHALGRPLASARIALITTAAPYRPDAGDQGPGAAYNAAAKFYRVYSGAGAAHNDPAPYVPQWLDDLRRGFPRSVVEQVQREALARKGWERLLLEPENLKVLKHDANLVAALLALKDMVPDESKALARSVVAPEEIGRASCRERV